MFYTPDSAGERLVVEYTGLNIHEIGELDFDEYLYYLRDAFIDRLNQTEDGRKYLENAYYYKQTKPDRSALREKFGKKKQVGGKHGDKH